jgi:NADPH:quinone reductase-like Zn-dependent oxidoreductase
MKAAFIERYGGPEVFQYGDFPDPIVGPSEVAIDIVATSVNAADWKVRLGEYKHTKLPLIPGRDFSGVVSAKGEDVKKGLSRCSNLAAALPSSLRVLRRQSHTVPM